MLVITYHHERSPKTKSINSKYDSKIDDIKEIMNAICVKYTMWKHISKDDMDDTHWYTILVLIEEDAISKRFVYRFKKNIYTNMKKSLTWLYKHTDEIFEKALELEEIVI